MKRINIFLFVLMLCLFAFVSCASGMIDKYPNGHEIEMTESYICLSGVFEDENINVVVSTEGTNSNSYLNMALLNKTSEILTIDGNKLVYSYGNFSSRLVDGNTRKINSNLSQADLVVAPNSILSVGLYTADDSKITTGIEGTLYLSLDNGAGKKTIGIELAQEQAVEQTKKETPEETVKVGTVSDKGKLWHFLFIGGAKTSVCERLLNKAKAKFGEDATIENVDYEISWNVGLSMLLYFDMLGYVQNYSATADVVVPK